MKVLHLHTLCDSDHESRIQTISVTSYQFYIVVVWRAGTRTRVCCELLQLLRDFNDIASTIGKGNGNLLVLLDLSAAFDTIDHVILFDILKKVYRF